MTSKFMLKTTTGVYTVKSANILFNYHSLLCSSRTYLQFDINFYSLSHLKKKGCHNEREFTSTALFFQNVFKCIFALLQYSSASGCDISYRVYE